MALARRDEIIAKYDNSTIGTVYDCYTNPSTKKCVAERAIMHEMLENNGYDYRILSYNTNMFTCAYRYKIGNAEMLVFHSKYRREYYLYNGRG